MRIEIRDSAREHGITDAEIRTVISFAAVEASIAGRREGAVLKFYAGPAAEREPWIEVIADHRDSSVAVVFHAMMLRRANVIAVGFEDHPELKYGRQRR